MRWRVIITDSEIASGVAPICPLAETNHLIEDDDGAPRPRVDAHGVYDCCPGPHLECWGEVVARDLAATLNRHEVEECT